MPSYSTHELEQQIRRAVGGRVSNLAVEFGPGRVVLRGRAGSYHVKQLAQHSLGQALPTVMPMTNAITVGRW